MARLLNIVNKMHHLKQLFASLKRDLLHALCFSLGIAFLSALFIFGGKVAFAIPSTPGIGSGAIGVDSANNLSIGTSTTKPETKLLVVASSTDSSNFVLKIIQPSQFPLFIVRNDGSVGIGTVVPSTKLEVVGAVSSTQICLGGSCQSSWPGGGAVSAANVTADVFGRLQGNGKFAFPDYLGVATSSQVGLPQTLSVYGGAYVSGNVGIGTAAPGAKLDVNGLLRFSNTGLMYIETLSQHLAFSKKSGAYAYYFRKNDDGTAGGANSVDLMRIEDSGNVIVPVGNVGIGTTDPMTFLRISEGFAKTDTGNRNVFFAGSNEAQASNPFGLITWVTGAAAIANRSVSLQTTDYNLVSGGNLALQPSGGNVGIGTSTPAGALDVANAFYTAAGQINIRQQSGAGLEGGEIDLSGSAGDPTFIIDNYDGNLRFVRTNPSGLDVVDILQNGNVGIGTATPGSPLHVIDNNANGIILERTSATARKWNTLITSAGKLDIYDQTVGADRFTIDTSGNVGIATTSPSYKLSVAGDINFTGNLYKNGTLFSSGGSSVGAAGTVQFSNGSGGFNGDATNFFWDDTNNRLGIGTAAPAEKLTVTGGNLEVNGIIYGQRAVGAGDVLLIGNDSKLVDINVANTMGVYGITDPTQGSIKLGSSGATITGSNTGNIGIGDTSPATKLEVVGAVSSTQICLGGSCQSSWPGGGAVSAANVTADVFGRLQGNGKFAFPDYLGVATSSQVGLPQALSVYGGAYVSGNVGIGTVSPTGQLSNNSINYGELGNGLSANSFNWEHAPNDSGWAAAISSKGVNGLVVGTDQTTGDAFQISSGAYSTITATRPNRLFTVLGSGNVGIGTVSPTVPLEVVGAVQAHDSGVIENAYNGILRITRNAATGQYINLVRAGQYPWSIGTVYNTSDFAIGTGLATDASFTTPFFVIKAGSGNVGIGTTGPGSILELKAAAPYLTFNNTGNDLNYIGSAPPLITGTGVNDLGIRTNSGAIVFSVGSAEKMRMQPSGNVGIGTTAPGAPLQVGTTNSRGVRIYGSTSPYGVSIMGDTGGWALEYNFYGNAGTALGGFGAYGANDALTQYYIGTNANQRMTILNGGNVGIGDTSPATKLEVAGDTSSTRICLGGTCNTSWPAGGVTSVFTRTGAVVAASGDYAVAQVTGAAPLASPTFTGNVTMPGTGIWNSSGNVGIGTAGPTIKLAIGDTDTGLGWGGDGQLDIYSNGVNTMNIRSGNAGIGTAAPGAKLDVNGTLRFNSVDCINGTCPANGVIRLTPNLHLNAAAGYAVILNWDNGTTGATQTLRIGNGASADAFTVLANGNVSTVGQIAANNGNEILYFTAAEGGTLKLVGSNGTNYFIENLNGTLRGVNSGWTAGIWSIDQSGNASFNGTVTANKINTNTIDPIYTIDGNKYATYVPSMTGQKEETAGVTHVTCSTQQGTCSAAIDFKNAAKGSDLWLFWQATDFGKNMENLTALLTPSFDGRVWYEKNAAANLLTIFASPDTSATCYVIRDSCEVSYRLTANRFDHEEWPNTSKDDFEGLKPPEKK